MIPRVRLTADWVWSVKDRNLLKTGSPNPFVTFFSITRKKMTAKGKRQGTDCVGCSGYSMGDGMKTE